MPSIKRLDAVFFRTTNGNEPVREWLKGLSKKQRRTIGEDVAYVQYKWPIGKPRVDHLRGAIWEIRSNLGNRMILLHGFIKKTQRTPNDDIELATKRFKEWEHGQK